MISQNLILIVISGSILQLITYSIEGGKGVDIIELITTKIEECNVNIGIGIVYQPE
jgi:hypothetical protein